MAKGTRQQKATLSEVVPPPDVVSPSPSTSDSSDVENLSNVDEAHAEGSYGVSASRPGSPSNGDGPELEDSVTCQWDDCSIVFTHLPTLISHIHNDHIGVHKSNYTCEWSSCLRRGLPQTSRFALISHIRSHTGEKPFICHLPECDKAFTRSDALAKHMRLQHNISPPAPGRGGSRKRKRGVDDGASTPNASAVASPSSIPNASGFNTFKVDPNATSELLTDDHGGSESHSRLDILSGTQKGKSSTNGRQKKHARHTYLQVQPQHTPSPDVQPLEDEDGYMSSTSDVLPPSLQQHFDESTGLVMGRTPAKIMYLLMKAKHRYAMEQHELLLQQLMDTKMEMNIEKEEKEHALDELLHRMLGPEAGILMPSGPPEVHFDGPEHSSTIDHQAMHVLQNGSRTRV